MNAKEYLMQIGLLKEKIRLKQEYVMTLKEKSISMGSLATDQDKVQSSPKDRLSEIIAEYVDADKEADEMIRMWQETIDRIVNEILAIPDKRYMQILKYRYIDQIENFNDIAGYMGYSYSRTIHMHGEALEEFRKLHLKS